MKVKIWLVVVVELAELGIPAVLQFGVPV